MQSNLLVDLMDMLNLKVFQIVVQLIIVGAIFLWIKDMNERVVNYFKLKLSDFGRGTQIKIDGYEGFIHSIGFNEVEITIDDNRTLLMPVNKFIKASKVIITASHSKKK